MVLDHFCVPRLDLGHIFSLNPFFYRESLASVSSFWLDSPRNWLRFSSKEDLTFFWTFPKDLVMIKFLSQADPHASSLRRVDVHGGEHVARDAVHRPPGPDAHAHQVEFEEYDAHCSCPPWGTTPTYLCLILPNRHQPDHAYLRHVPLYKV